MEDVIIAETMEALFQKKQIPNELNKAKLSDENRTLLMQGQWTNLIPNLELSNGNVMDGKIRFTKNAKGEIEANYNFKKTKLEIPEHILDTELSKEQTARLKKNDVVGPLDYNGKQFYIKVDNDLNRVVVLSPNEFAIKSKVGEYKLTDADKNNLANNKPISTRVFKGTNGYFLAGLERVEENGMQGLAHTNVKPISEKQAKELIPQYNVEKLKEGKTEESETNEATKGKKKEDETRPDEKSNLGKTIEKVANASFREM